MDGECGSFDLLGRWGFVEMVGVLLGSGLLSLWEVWRCLG